MSNSGDTLEELNLTSWEIKQLVKSGLYADEHAALRSAVRALFLVHPEAKVRMVVGAYASGEIGLGKAAALLGVSQEEMKDVLREAGTVIHLGPATEQELVDDANNA